MTLPHAAHPKGRDRLAALLQLIRYPQLTPAWLLDRQFDHCRLDRRIHPVGQDRLCPADLLQRQLATLVVELLEPVKAVAAVPHHLAGLADPGLRRGRLLPSCLASSNRPTLARITFCACVIGGPQLTSSRRHLPQLDLPHRSLTIVRLSPYLYTSRDTLYRRLRFLDRRTRRPSPLRTDLRRAVVGIWPSPGLPTQRRRRSDPNDTSQTRSPLSGDGSSSPSPGASRDAPAATRRSAKRQKFQIMYRFLAGLIAASLALASNNAAAADQNIVITQSLEQAHTIDPATVEQLPASEQKVSFLTQLP